MVTYLADLTPQQVNVSMQWYLGRADQQLEVHSILLQPQPHRGTAAGPPLMNANGT